MDHELVIGMVAWLGMSGWVNHCMAYGGSAESMFLETGVS